MRKLCINFMTLRIGISTLTDEQGMYSHPMFVRFDHHEVPSIKLISFHSVHWIRMSQNGLQYTTLRPMVDNQNIFIVTNLSLKTQEKFPYPQFDLSR